MNEVDLFAMGGGLPQGVHQYYAQTYNPAYPTPHGYAKGGEIASAIFNPNSKKGKISTSFGGKTKEGLTAMIENDSYSAKEIANAIFEYNEKRDRVETNYGDKTKEGLISMIESARDSKMAKGGKTQKLIDKIAQKEFGKNYSELNDSDKYFVDDAYATIQAKKYGFAKGGDIPVGFHKMPNGEIMADSEHLAEGGETIDGFTLNTIKGVANKPTNVDIDKLDINYAEGGEIDLFEDYEKQPKELSEIVETYQERYADGDMDYESTKEFLGKVNAIGYTFDSGLDNEPFGLRKMAKGGEVKEGKYKVVKNWSHSIVEGFDSKKDAIDFSKKYTKEQIDLGYTDGGTEVMTESEWKKKSIEYYGDDGKNELYAKGGRTKHSLMQDRRRVSSEPWEVAYQKRKAKMEKGGEVNYQDIRSRMINEVGFDRALSIIQREDDVVDPETLIRSAVRLGKLSKEEVNRALINSAESESDSLNDSYKDSGFGFGSSDMSASVKSVLRDAGYQDRMEAGGTLPTPFGQAGLVGETGTMNEVDLFAMGGGLPQGVHQYYAQTYNPAYPTPHGYAKGGQTDGDTLGDFKKRLLELGDKEFVEYKEKQLKNRQDLYYAFQDRLKDVHKQTIVVKDDLPFAKGGKIGFDGLAKKVAKKYEGKPVKADFQSEYGKTYSKAEAMEVGKKVAGKVYQQQQSMAKGGLTDSKYIPSFEIYEVVTKDGKVYENDYSAMEFLSGAYISDKVVTKEDDKDGSQMTLFDKGGKIPKGAIYIKRRDIDFITVGEDEDDKEKVSGKNLFNGFWIDPKKQKTLIAEATKDGRLGKSKAKVGDKVKLIKGAGSETVFRNFPNGEYEVKKVKKGNKVVPEGFYEIENKDGNKTQLATSRFETKMAKGGKTQGYNDKLDESLGNTKGKSSSKEQNYKDRRNESEAMENKGSKRKYSSVKTMDKGNRSKRRTPMSLAKEIRKEGENWQQAVKRASAILKKEYADK